MSSLEIAELTGKRHDNVKRDIQVMFKELEMDILKVEDASLNHQYQEVEIDSPKFGDVSRNHQY